MTTPSLRSALPADGIVVDGDAMDARTSLLALYEPPEREWLRLNLVATLDGRAAGADGTSDSLTSRLDRLVLGVIREQSDIVLVGAGSVRKEGYLRPRRAALAVLTESGDLAGHRLDGESAHPFIVVTTPRGAAEAARTAPGAEIVVLESDGDGVSLRECLGMLRERGFRSIVAEGGPTLAAQLLEHELVDEVCLTIMPRIGGPALPVFGADALPSWPARPHRLLIGDDGAQFGRWLLKR